MRRSESPGLGRRREQFLQFGTHGANILGLAGYIAKNGSNDVFKIPVDQLIVVPTVDQQRDAVLTALLGAMSSTSDRRSVVRLQFQTPISPTALIVLSVEHVAKIRAGDPISVVAVGDEAGALPQPSDRPETARSGLRRKVGAEEQARYQSTAV